MCCGACCRSAGETSSSGTAASHHRVREPGGGPRQARGSGFEKIGRLRDSDLEKLDRLTLAADLSWDGSSRLPGIRLGSVWLVALRVTQLVATGT